MTTSPYAPQRKIYIVGEATGYANWMGGQLVDNMEDSDLVCWTGGADIQPTIYGARRHPSTSFSASRDAYEIKEFKQARAMGKHLIGICRGSQLLGALSGAKLVQDQPNPHYMHPIETYDGKTIMVSSTHHQCQWPWDLPSDQFKVLGWATGISSYHWGEYDGDEMVLGRVPGDKETEVCFYPQTRVLAIQSHPESCYQDARHGDEDAVEYISWCRATLDAHLVGAL